jgi:hypothetical protein
MLFIIHTCFCQQFTIFTCQHMTLLFPTRLTAAAATTRACHCRRLNVALTRARRGLIVICDPSTLKSDRVWRAWLAWASRQGLVLPAPLPLPPSMRGPQRGLPMPRGLSPGRGGSQGLSEPADTAASSSTMATSLEPNAGSRPSSNTKLPLPTPQSRRLGEQQAGEQGSEEGFFDDSSYLSGDHTSSSQDPSDEAAGEAALRSSKGHKQQGGRSSRSQMQGKRPKQKQQGQGRAGGQGGKQTQKVEVKSWPVY